MYRILFLVLIVFSLCNTHAFAQQTNHKLDSLLQVSEKYLKEDTTKVNMLMQISRLYRQVKIDESLKFSNQAIKIAEKLNLAGWTGAAYGLNGENLNAKGDKKAAIEAYETASKYYEIINDTENKLANINNIGNVYLSLSNYTKALEYFEIAQKGYQKLGRKLKEGIAMLNMGIAYWGLSELKKSLDFTEKALAIFRKENNKSMMAVSFSRLGAVSLSLSDYSKALDVFLSSLKINEELGNKNRIALDLDQISRVYSRLGDNAKAIEYELKALEIAESLGDNLLVCQFLSNVGTLYYDSKQYEKSMELHKKSLTIAEKWGYKAMINTCLMNMAANGIKTNNYTNVSTYVKRFSEITKELKISRVEAESLRLIGYLYYFCPDSILIKNGIKPSERYDKSIEMHQQSLDIYKKIGNKQEIGARLEDLSLAYEKKGDYQKAYQLFRERIAIKDSIASDDIKQQITRKEVQYEFDKKEAELKFQNQLTAEQLEKQTLLTTQQQQELLLQTQNLRLKDQALTISNKEKDLQRLAYLKEKAEKQEKEQQLSLVEKDKQIQASKLVLLVKEKAIQVQTLAKKNALIGFLFSSLAGLLLAALAFYLWQRQKTLKQEKNNSMNFTKQLLESTESERRRIASDLHDSISHELLTLKSVFQQDIGIVNSKIDSIINDVRSISRNLHPVMFDKIGLVPNIMQFVERLQNQSEFLVSTDIKYENSLTSSDELQIYRIIQEALTNIIKYSEAHAAKITIVENVEGMQLEIRDNGHGFDVKQVLNSGKAFGLHNIIERSRAIGGEASIKSSGKGTIIKISIPKNKNNVA